MKYRIVQGRNNKTYYIQKKRLFGWSFISYKNGWRRYFDTFEEAEKELYEIKNKYDIIKTYDDSDNKSLKAPSFGPIDFIYETFESAAKDTTGIKNHNSDNMPLKVPAFDLNNVDKIIKEIKNYKTLEKSDIIIVDHMELIKPNE